jgi:hypothetical protein
MYYLIRHLSDVDNREIYEAAHSVMLALFAAHEAQSLPGMGKPKFNRVHLLVPAYIDILLHVCETYSGLKQRDTHLTARQNSDEGRLSTDQLRLAFQALVRSAGSRDDELGWFCVEQLVVAIKQLAINHPGTCIEFPIIPSLWPWWWILGKSEQILRLQLALVSSISAVPTSKLLLALGAVYDQMLSNETSRGALAEAAYHEIVERLGDREKDIALKWWLSTKTVLDSAQ